MAGYSTSTAAKIENTNCASTAVTIRPRMFTPSANQARAEADFGFIGVMVLHNTPLSYLLSTSPCSYARSPNMPLRDEGGMFGRPPWMAEVQIMQEQLSAHV